jgi:hypothetical protein
LLPPALNEMIDITTTRTMAASFHPPPVVFVMVAIVDLEYPRLGLIRVDATDQVLVDLLRSMK